MDGWRYFDIAKKIIGHISDGLQFASKFWMEILIMIASAWFFLKIIDFIIAYTSRRTVTAKVNHKERIYYPTSLKSMYLVFTDQGVFRNQDSWAYLSFNSSDTYRTIENGQTYQLTIYGYRNRWNSEYPNILKTKQCLIGVGMT